MIDPTPMWDFDDPAASLVRFREAAAAAGGDERQVLLTQVARALGLQEQYAEGHATLDELTSQHPEVRARVALERGRLHRSAGNSGEARPLFEQAADIATGAGLDAVRVDALHMVALVAEPADRLGLNEAALAVARASDDPRARDWDASLLNNIGMVHADAGRLKAALRAFEEALKSRERIGDPARTRVAHWMVAWTLRLMGRPEEALGIQRALKAELDAVGARDPYVDEELELLERT